MLMETTRAFFSKYKLDISESKSKILSYNAATDKISFEAPNQPPLILDQVLAFKYLGIWEFSPPNPVFFQLGVFILTGRNAASVLGSGFDLTTGFGCE